jgi:hypothetical protein
MGNKKSHIQQRPIITEIPFEGHEVESSEDRALIFVDKAPDAPKSRDVKRGKKVPITVTVPGMMLEELNVMAESLGQSRAALINLAIARLLRDMNPAKGS